MKDCSKCASWVGCCYFDALFGELEQLLACPFVIKRLKHCVSSATATIISYHGWTMDWHELFNCRKKNLLQGVAGFGFWWHGERGGFVSVNELIKNWFCCWNDDNTEEVLLVTCWVCWIEGVVLLVIWDFTFQLVTCKLPVFEWVSRNNEGLYFHNWSCLLQLGQFLEWYKVCSAHQGFQGFYCLGKWCDQPVWLNWLLKLSWTSMLLYCCGARQSLGMFLFKHGDLSIVKLTLTHLLGAWMRMQLNLFLLAMSLEC